MKPFLHLAALILACLVTPFVVSAAAGPEYNLEELRYSTYLGGNGTERICDTALGPDGSIYVAGWTNSFFFPITPG